MNSQPRQPSASSLGLPRNPQRFTPAGSREVWFLCGAANPASRRRFEEESLALGARPRWLDPHRIAVGAEGGLRYAGEDVRPPLVAIARTGGLTTKRALAALESLEAAEVPLVDSVAAVALCRDKLRQLDALSAGGLPVPETRPVAVSRPGDEAVAPACRALVAELGGFPLVVKRAQGMGGEGVELVRDEAALDVLLDLPETAPDRPVLAQRYVPAGFDVRVIVVGGEALGAMRRTHAPGEFRANLALQGVAEAQPLSADLAELALRSAAAVGAEVAGVDMLPDGEGWLVLEVNTAPGFEGFERVTGVNVAEKVVRYALERGRRSDS